MSYTYSGNPSSSKVDETHYRLGNTNPANPIATDEEVRFALANNGGNTWLAAAEIAENKSMEFLWQPTRVIRSDGSGVHRDNQADHFMVMARQLRLNATIATVTPGYVGGLSQSEHDADAQEAGLRQPFARKHLHEPPGTTMHDMEREY